MKRTKLYRCSSRFETTTLYGERGTYGQLESCCQTTVDTFVAKPQLTLVPYD